MWFHEFVQINFSRFPRFLFPVIAYSKLLYMYCKHEYVQSISWIFWCNLWRFLYYLEPLSAAAAAAETTFAAAALAAASSSAALASIVFLWLEMLLLASFATGAKYLIWLPLISQKKNNQCFQHYNLTKISRHICFQHNNFLVTFWTFVTC